MNNLPQRLMLVVFASVAGLLSIGQLVPSDTSQVAVGETLPQVLLWLVGWVVLVMSLLLSGSLQTMSLSGRRLVSQSREAIGVSSRDQFDRRTTLLYWIVSMMIFIIVWVFFAAWHSYGTGNFRYAVNAWWQWVAWFATFFLVFRLLQIGDAPKAIVIWMIALCFLVSVHSVYQVMVSLPADRERFRNDPQAVLEEAGIDATPGSSTYMLFEGRLQDASPTGPFALTNSLAGFLLPWLVVLFAQGLESFLTKQVYRQARVVPFVVATLMLWVFVMTKSRSAWIALAIACLICCAIQPRIANQLRRLINPGALAVGGFLFVCLGALFLWDRKIVLEAPQSLQYRIEYWRTSIVMAQKNIWFGVGPGNFQTQYSTYKIPESSETVADPHQFLLETLATAGFPALIALLVIMFLMFYGGMKKVFLRIRGLAPGDERLLENGRRSELKINKDGTLYTVDSNSDKYEGDKSGIDEASRRSATIAIYVGGVTGLLFVWLSLGALGPLPMVAPYWFGVPMVIGYLLWEVNRKPEQDQLVESVRKEKPGDAYRASSSGAIVGIGPAIIAMLIHLLAAGGWMTPGVGNSLAVLVAIWFFDTGSRSIQAKSEGSLALRRALGQQTKESFQSWFVAIGAVTPLLLLLVFYYSTWLPTQHLKSIQGRLLNGEMQLTSNRLEEFIASDPWDPMPLRFVADRAYREAVEALSRNPILQPPANGALNTTQISYQSLKAARDLGAQYRAKDRSNWQAWLQSGYWELEAAVYNFDSLALSLEYFQEASRLAPSDLGILTQVSLVAWIADHQSIAHSHLARAGELNEKIVHVDRKLFGARVYWPASLGPKSVRIAPNIWRKVRDAAASGASNRPGWVRAEPVFEFLRTQITNVKETR